MRIRKLAAELSVDEQDLLGLIGRLGHPRYKDVEQQLPTSLEATVRRAARSLPRVSPPPSLPTPVARAVHADPETQLFAQAMASVRPLGPDASRPRTPERTVSPARAPSEPAKAAPRPAPASLRPARGAPARPEPPLELRYGEALARVAELEAQVASMTAERASLRMQIADAGRAVAAAVERESEARARVQELADRLASLDAEAVSLRTVAERRGLRGEDELAVALRGLLDAHRIPDLARLVVARPGDVELLLRDRVILLTKEEPAPTGLVAVRVPPDRSEGRLAPLNRAALVRFSSACLVNGVRRVAVVGGSLSQHRVLKEGVDPRVELVLLPPGQRRLPTADLVLWWVEQPLPGAIAVPEPTLVALLAAGADAAARLSAR